MGNPDSTEEKEKTPTNTCSIDHLCHSCWCSWLPVLRNYLRTESCSSISRRMAASHQFQAPYNHPDSNMLKTNAMNSCGTKCVFAGGFLTQFPMGMYPVFVFRDSLRGRINEFLKNMIGKHIESETANQRLTGRRLRHYRPLHSSAFGNKQRKSCRNRGSSLELRGFLRRWFERSLCGRTTTATDAIFSSKIEFTNSIYCHPSQQPYCG